jgi:hypothetical protein
MVPLHTPAMREEQVVVSSRMKDLFPNRHKFDNHLLRLLRNKPSVKRSWLQGHVRYMGKWEIRAYCSISNIVEEN